jgi:hypothetical protein
LRHQKLELLGFLVRERAFDILCQQLVQA